MTPDSSHWANWIDDVLSTRRERGDAEDAPSIAKLPRRIEYFSCHGTMSWNCWELTTKLTHARESPFCNPCRYSLGCSCPNNRLVQALSQTSSGRGRVLAIDAGCNTLTAVRDYVRKSLVRMGPGSAALGTDPRVWQIVRREVRAARPQSSMVAAFGDFRPFDENKTVAEIATMARRTTKDRVAAMTASHASAFHKAAEADNRRRKSESLAIADAFAARIQALIATDSGSVRDLIASAFAASRLGPG